jgi:hypothetical protein
MGSSRSVNKVQEISPPITTIASGRCISDPGPVANSSGTSPSAAIDAVSSTGRSRRCAPLTTTSEHVHAGRPQLVEIADQHDPVQHRDAEQRDETDRSRHRQIFAGQAQREDAADHRERHVGHGPALAWRSESKVL